MSDAVLPPLFQIITGLSFLAILLVRFLAGRSLKPIWGRVVAFSLIFLALGSFLLSLATAKSSMFAAAELFAFAGGSFAIATLLVLVGLFLAARGFAAGMESAS